MDSATFDELSVRVRSLLISVSERLPTQKVGLVDELIDAGEFGIALETMADILGDEETMISSQERAEFTELTQLMAMGDRVHRALTLCPTRD